MNLEKFITDITLFLVMSIIMEYVVGILTEKLPTAFTKYVNANIISLLIGIILAFMFKLDIFASLGLQTSWVIVAWLITGVLLAGGSKLWHELIAKLRASRQDIETNNRTSLAPIVLNVEDPYTNTKTDIGTDTKNKYNYE